MWSKLCQNHLRQLPANADPHKGQKALIWVQNQDNRWEEGACRSLHTNRRAHFGRRFFITTARLQKFCGGGIVRVGRLVLDDLSRNLNRRRLT